MWRSYQCADVCCSDAWLLASAVLPWAAQVRRLGVMSAAGATAFTRSRSYTPTLCRRRSSTTRHRIAVGGVRRDGVAAGVIPAAATGDPCDHPPPMHAPAIGSVVRYGLTTWQYSRCSVAAAPRGRSYSRDPSKVGACGKMTIRPTAWRADRPPKFGLGAAGAWSNTCAGQDSRSARVSICLGQATWPTPKRSCLGFELTAATPSAQPR